MNKALLKKWWFWVIVVVALSAIGAVGQSGDDKSATTTDTKQQATESTAASTLPQLNAEEYKGKEGLVVYKELKTKGYKVDATFENQALTDINGNATDVFEPLNVNKAEDKQSVDSFVVGSLTQNGDSVTLTIVKTSN